MAHINTEVERRIIDFKAAPANVEKLIFLGQFESDTLPRSTQREQHVHPFGIKACYRNAVGTVAAVDTRAWVSIINGARLRA